MRPFFRLNIHTMIENKYILEAAEMIRRGYVTNYTPEQLAKQIEEKQEGLSKPRDKHLHYGKSDFEGVAISTNPNIVPIAEVPRPKSRFYQ
jgi:hypothetical protein